MSINEILLLLLYIKKNDILLHIFTLEGVKMRKKIMQIVKNISHFINILNKDRIGVYTAQASFFMLLSIFPFVLLFLNIIGFTSINQNTII